jgi:hypothetical protein
MAVRGDLHVSSSITEEQLEEMEVDKQLHREAVAKLKERLSIKIREQEALEARLLLFAIKLMRLNVLRVSRH